MDKYNNYIYNMYTYNKLFYFIESILATHLTFPVK